LKACYYINNKIKISPLVCGLGEIIYRQGDCLPLHIIAIFHPVVNKHFRQEHNMNIISVLASLINGLGGWVSKIKPPRQVTIYLAGIITALVLFIITTQIVLDIFKMAAYLTVNMPTPTP
jgi:hypothetical protein